MIRFALVALTMSFNLEAWAQASDSEFSIDSKFAGKLFDSLVKREEQPLPRANLKIEAGYGQFQPTELTLQNQYYEVAYADGTRNLPFGSLRIGRVIAKALGTDWSLFAQAGYSNAQQLQTVASKTGIGLRDSIALQWVPIHAGVGADFGRVGLQFLRLGAQAAAGSEWFHQAGTLDGVEQNFWLPTVAAGPELTFFPADATAGGFDGVTVGGEYRLGLATSQRLSGWGFRVTTGFVM